MHPPETDMYAELRELGFRCGLETHQQLATSNKLFCRCPARIRNDSPDAELLRHMRPTLSEFGEYDGTALMEFKTKKQVHYLLYNDSVCTYEMDDTPPFKADPEAVDIALEIAMMFNMSLVDEIHITRKQYLDGSIPTGFQRTAIMGVNGRIPFLGRTLGFFQLSMEEDACREVDDRGHHVWFRTDRLSIPLVESVTMPELLTPAEAAAGAALVGEVMRSTGRVRRGIGSVRQDVNVSIRGGTRVEIKGVPRIGLIEDLCRVEGYRQKGLLDLRAALLAEGLEPGSFDASPLFLAPAGPDPGVENAVQVLPGFERFLDWPLQPGMTFLDEIDGRVRVIACLEGSPCVRRASEEARAAAGVVGAGDAVLVFEGPHEDLLTAARETVARVREAFEGVPSETRQALPGGRTTFERILPGPDRMYPDTDLPPEPVPEETVEAIRGRLRPRPWERREAWSALGVPEQLCARLINWGSADLFDRTRASARWHAPALASLLTDRRRGSRRAGADWSRLGDEGIASALVSCFEHGLSTRGAARVLDAMSMAPGLSAGEAIAACPPEEVRP